ncbi:CPBP family intramembrane glutamic endopeptidase [Alloiococcus sp. CFN-8]|uniref:CPBP family intramembrane glutamic endopeptidase n=1 Tax=Alloiococcus sp. CFN-8 TaxID=3416081 RepID=UPI003CF96FDD
MTKFFKATGLSAIYFFIYFGFQIIFIFLFIFIDAILNRLRGIATIPEAAALNIYNYFGYAIALSILASLGIYLIIFRLRKRRLIYEISLKSLDVKPIFYLLLLAIASSLLAGFLVSALIPYFPSYNEVSESITSTTENAFGVMVTTLMVPFFEEVLFRGLIYREFKKFLPFIPALIIQGLIFGAAHGNMLQFIYAFLLGLLLGAVYHWFKTLWAPIIVHCGFNLLGSLILPNYLYTNKILTIVYIIAGILLTILCLFKLRYLGISSRIYVEEKDYNVENSI